MVWVYNSHSRGTKKGIRLDLTTFGRLFAFKCFIGKKIRAIQGTLFRLDSWKPTEIWHLKKFPFLGGNTIWWSKPSIFGVPIAVNFFGSGTKTPQKWQLTWRVLENSPRFSMGNTYPSKIIHAWWWIFPPRSSCYGLRGCRFTTWWFSTRWALVNQL